jgi:hypothetical protein
MYEIIFIAKTMVDATEAADTFNHRTHTESWHTDRRILDMHNLIDRVVYCLVVLLQSVDAEGRESFVWHLD